MYVRFGEWPTTELHDAKMHCDLKKAPRATFTLQADRLLNERLCILVLADGMSWATYTVTANAAVSGRLMAALGLAGAVILFAVAALLYTLRARPRKAALGP